MRIIETYIVYYPKRTRLVKLHKAETSTGSIKYHLEVDTMIYAITTDEALELING